MADDPCSLVGVLFKQWQCVPNIVVQRMRSEQRNLAAKHLKRRNLDARCLRANAEEQGGPTITHVIDQPLSHLRNVCLGLRL